MPVTAATPGCYKASGDIITPGDIIPPIPCRMTRVTLPHPILHGMGGIMSPGVMISPESGIQGSDTAGYDATVGRMLTIIP